MVKQAIVIRTDLKMGKGKIAAQCSHASVEAADKSSKTKVSAWAKQGSKKVVLKVSSEHELLELQQKAKEQGMVASVIRDAGRTQVESGTVTALGIGPDEDTKIDKVTGKLKLL